MRFNPNFFLILQPEIYKKIIMGNSCDVESRPKSFREFIKSRKLLYSLIGIILGVSAGFLYYYFIGCSSGSCAITSNPYSSMLFGGFIGLFITNRPCGC